jgi:integrase
LKLYRQKKSKVWWVTFRVNGQRYRLSTEKLLKTPAGSVAADLLKEVENGNLPQKRNRFKTLTAYAVEFTKHVDAIRKTKTQTYYRTGWRLLKDKAICKMQMSAIRAVDVNLLEFEGSPSNANCALRTLRRMLHLAEESGSLAKVPKFPLREEHSRHGRLLDAEAERSLLPHCDKLLADVIKLMRDTGMRNERELLQLRVENLDFNYRTIFVPDSKTPSGSRHVPMTSRALEILRERAGERREGWIFPSKRAKGGHTICVGKAFRKARRAAKLPESLVLYCGRHDYGTKVMQATGNLAVVMKTMGHVDPKTAMKYQHPDVQQVGDALNKLNSLAVN